MVEISTNSCYKELIELACTSDKNMSDEDFSIIKEACSETEVCLGGQCGDTTQNMNELDIAGGK